MQNEIMEHENMKNEVMESEKPKVGAWQWNNEN